MRLPLLFYKDFSAVSVPDSAALPGLPAGFYCNRAARENSRHFLKLGGGGVGGLYLDFCCQTCLTTVVRKEGLRSLWNSELSQTS